MYVAKTQTSGCSPTTPPWTGTPLRSWRCSGTAPGAGAPRARAVLPAPGRHPHRRVVGAEALIRWQHPERGLVFPDEFIPLAEHSTLIGPLTRHVLQTALAQARLWSRRRPTADRLGDLSARNLLDEGLPGQVAELLAAIRRAPGLLTRGDRRPRS